MCNNDFAIQKELSSAIVWTEKLILSVLPDQIKEYCYTFNRRLETLRLAAKFCRKGSIILDAGAGQGFHGLVLKKMGYKVIAIDVNDQYATFMRKNGIEFYRANLEYNLLPLKQEVLMPYCSWKL